MSIFRKKSKVYGPRRGQKQTLLAAIRDLPNFLRLLYGLVLDSRVSPIDKVMLGGAIAYILLPVDLIPDVIPFMGQVDDMFLLVYSLRRLIENAGRRVLQDHWMGSMDELNDLRLEQILAAAAFFLPGRIKKRLRRMAHV